MQSKRKIRNTSYKTENLNIEKITQMIGYHLVKSRYQKLETKLIENQH